MCFDAHEFGRVTASHLLKVLFIDGLKLRQNLGMNYMHRLGRDYMHRDDYPVSRGFTIS